MISVKHFQVGYDNRVIILNNIILLIDIVRRATMISDDFRL